MWTNSKGLNDFYRIRELLQQDIKMTLVGLSEKQIRNLPSGINGIVRTSNSKELAELYGSNYVFVNPTYNDSFPTVNLEALACGTPVVTYRTGGSPEAIDENTGIIVEKGDVYGLVESITQIIDNPQKYTSTACRERATTYFNQDIQYRKYVKLYERLISDSLKSH